MPPIRRFVPSAVTLLGLLASLLALVWAPDQPYWACLAIIAGSLIDMVDGRVARLLDAQTELGAQLDSLVDVVAFGITPAFVAYHAGLSTWPTVLGVPTGLLPAFAYAAATAVRLARFNLADAPTSDFVGVPSPVGALLVTTTLMVSFELSILALRSPTVVAAVLLASAALMVSPARFPSYKRFATRWGQLVFYGSIGGGLTLLALRLPGGTVLSTLLWLYVIRGLAGARRAS